MATSDSTTKRCSKCKQELPATREYFSPRKDRPLGLQSSCRVCRAKAKRLKRANSPRNQDMRQLEASGQKRCKTCKQIFPATNEYFGNDNDGRAGLKPHCKSCVNSKNRDYRNNNPEFRAREKQKQKEYSQKPEVKIRLQQQRKARRLNPEFIKRERELERKRMQTERGWLIKKAAYERRRAKLMSADGTHTAADIEAQYRSQRGRCWHCGKELNGKYHVDHLIPLDRGGTNWPDNIVCSCAPCNHSKYNKLTQEWNGRLF